MLNETLHEIKTDMKEVRKDIQELVKQGAIMNETLIEHERRSTNLETRVKPLEDIHIFFSKAGAVILFLGSILSILYRVIK